MESTHKTDSLEQAQRLVKSVQIFYSTFAADSISNLDQFYTQDVEFVDPVHSVTGCLALKGYLKKLATDLQHYSIRYTHQLIGNDSAYLSWEMDYAHPKIESGRILTIQGISHLKFSTKVFYHEDCYDLGAMLYEHVPLLGGVTRKIKHRLVR